MVNSYQVQRDGESLTARLDTHYVHRKRWIELTYTKLTGDVHGRLSCLDGTFHISSRDRDLPPMNHLLVYTGRNPILLLSQISN